MGGQAVPRYSQIVGELRRRIERGELAPGDRVPSTREITKQWGVAMATATKVLTELRHEGMVRAVPGVGTVVAAPSRPARAAHPAAASRPGRPSEASSAQTPLTLGRIVGAAVTVADTEGLAAVSMRRVAFELGVATMSLYRHVAHKDDLLTRMMDTAIAEYPLPADPPDGWREAVELAARQLWDLFRRHPWFAPALSVTRPQMITSALPYSEWMLATLHAHGLDLHSAFTAHLMMLNYARGVAVHLESEQEAEAHSGLDNEEWMDTQEPALLANLATGRFPELSRLATAGYDLDLDALFEFGLQRLLDGLAALLNESSAD
ncbi:MULTISPECIES: TetR/AcrR family transcriptional regulator C-terminal domain-containing protein [unclassified Streptomyces]|uniref:TetR/AcrR family transcriptional regulator C-terminal domain-containing protein n=1 Tax=unclassified Streptomyces TaxID=2593676 RepID=UPI002E12A466|nr:MULTISPECIES: TetR/AcrR family transcriptional regulator C-terminal domain-containing protein [unclassified Streptomyces]WSR23441.1 TetR/AcrR family transcriptional regulator C-terminal domain-containing protein [Streptomyces sp. NBC_01205]